MVLDRNSSQEFSVNAGNPQGSILGPTLFLLYTNNFSDNIICDIAIFELKSDLQDTVDWCKKWLVDFNTGKTLLFSFDQSKNNGSIDVKMDESALKEKSSFKMLGLTISSKLNWGYYLYC